MNQKKLRVCNGSWCCRYGSTRIFQVIKKAFGLKFRNKNAKIDLDYCKCLGYCSSGPNVAVDDGMIFLADEDTVVEEILKGGEHRERGGVEMTIEDSFLGDI